MTATGLRPTAPAARPCAPEITSSSFSVLGMPHPPMTGDVYVRLVGGTNSTG